MGRLCAKAQPVQVQILAQVLHTELGIVASFKMRNDSPVPASAEDWLREKAPELLQAEDVAQQKSGLLTCFLNAWMDGYRCMDG